jgi:hypothetical protein
MPPPTPTKADHRQPSGARRPAPARERNKWEAITAAITRMKIAKATRNRPPLRPVAKPAAT